MKRGPGCRSRPSGLGIPSETAQCEQAYPLPAIQKLEGSLAAVVRRPAIGDVQPSKVVIRRRGGECRFRQVHRKRVRPELLKSRNDPHPL